LETKTDIRNTGSDRDAVTAAVLTGSFADPMGEKIPMPGRNRCLVWG